MQRRRRLPRPRLAAAVTPPAASLKWLLTAVAGWLLLSLILFMVSAWIQRKNTSDAARSALTAPATR